MNLKISWWGSADRDTRTQMVIDLFKSKNPGINITTEHYTSTQGAVGTGYWPTLLKHADDKTLPDIMQHDYAYIEEWTTKGNLRALDDLVADKTINLADVPAALVDGGKVAGKIMGITLGVNTQAMVLDVDAFNAAGVAIPNDDWTWEDFERIALEIKMKSNIFGAGTGLHGYTPGWKAIILSKDHGCWSADGKALGYTRRRALDRALEDAAPAAGSGGDPQRADEPKRQQRRGAAARHGQGGDRAHPEQPARGALVRRGEAAEPADSQPQDHAAAQGQGRHGRPST